MGAQAVCHLPDARGARLPGRQHVKQTDRAIPDDYCRVPGASTTDHPVPNTSDVEGGLVNRASPRTSALTLTSRGKRAAGRRE
ncbi:hypothetical protein GCM10017781_19370 [Deinococcus metalli]|uniref:Uncharacterized protein n=1 Tax=Deinococcus metalli TaxID=1141878 RepID=A0ABQ3JQ04_9DEIO|nr:hypothetical protein GCM10017781_19370 [Deinococcus metalli]